MKKVSFIFVAADFAPEAGLLTVYGDVIGIGAYGGKYYYVGALGAGDNAEFHFDVPESGKAVLNDIVSMFLYSGGTWDSVISGTLSRISNDYSYEEPEEAAANAALVISGSRNDKSKKTNLLK